MDISAQLTGLGIYCNDPSRLIEKHYGIRCPLHLETLDQLLVAKSCHVHNRDVKLPRHTRHNFHAIFGSLQRDIHKHNVWYHFANLHKCPQRLEIDLCFRTF